MAGIISLSCPRQSYSAPAEQQPDFTQRMAEAEALVASGRGEEYLWAPTSGAQGLFTARTYVSKYGRHERNDVRHHAARLGCPLLATAGEAEDERQFRSYARELAGALGNRGACHIVDGTDHFYRGYEPLVTDLIARWLERLGA